jgi:hypothetical protein
MKESSETIRKGTPCESSPTGRSLQLVRCRTPFEHLSHR